MGVLLLALGTPCLLVVVDTLLGVYLAIKTGGRKSFDLAALARVVDKVAALVMAVAGPVVLGSDLRTVSFTALGVAVAGVASAALAKDIDQKVGQVISL